MALSYTDYIKQLIKDKMLEKERNIFALKPYNNSMIKVVSILDEFSYNCFKYEANLYQLGINNWKDTIDMVNPDFLFVEAAWEGINNEWKNKIANINNSKDESLDELISYCKSKLIPTVFWAKEDPYDFYIFLDSAKIFDYIFTTDENSIQRYKDILNHKNVYLLPFAAQPKIHNPIDKDKEKKGQIMFSGGWYKKFPDRCKNMIQLLDAAARYDLTIYDRFYNSIDSKNSFPSKYKPFIRRSLNYLDMVKTYKSYEILLNFNSTDKSPTNFSRRVFEVLASGIPMISSYSVGIENYFGDIVMFSKTKNETFMQINKLLNDKYLREKLSVLGQRVVFNNHTYSHRLNTILETIGLESDLELNPGVTVITCTNRNNSLENILTNYLSQEYPVKELILVINNNTIPTNIWREVVKFNDDIKIYTMDEKYTLGECLNFAIENASYKYISKFDDDDFYGPYYLRDSMNAFKYTDAAIVGKHTIYAYIEDLNELVIRFPNNENRYIDYVAGSTLTFKKEVSDRVKFKKLNKSEDTTFLKEALSLGYKIYSTNRFNHVVHRRKDLNTHTWKISQKDFLKKSISITKTKDYKNIVTV